MPSNLAAAEPGLTAPAVDPGLTTLEQANEQAPLNPSVPVISAKDALGLDESPRDSLREVQEKVSKNVPEEKIPRDDTGKFTSTKAKERAAKAAKAVTPPPAPSPAPAAPSTPPPAPSPAPEAPKKVKIGDKEYTTAELEQALKERNQPAAPTAPAAPAAPAKPAPTPEEIAAAEAKFISEFAPKIADSTLNEDRLEKILVGGKEGVAELGGLLKEVAARAILETRKSIYDELNPVLGRLHEQVSPLLQNNAQLERHATEMAFTTTFPEYHGDNLATARLVAEELLKQYPDVVKSYTREQFLTEVDRQSDRIISAEFKRWHPEYAGTWRDWAKASKTPAAAAPVAPAPTAPAAAPAPARPASAKPKATPPAGNSPGAVTGAPKDWQKGVAGSLTD